MSQVCQAHYYVRCRVRKANSWMSLVKTHSLTKKIPVSLTNHLSWNWTNRYDKLGFPSHNAFQINNSNIFLDCCWTWVLLYILKKEVAQTCLSAYFFLLFLPRILMLGFSGEFRLVRFYINSFKRFHASTAGGCFCEQLLRPWRMG